jgi:Na+/melibiose symporter-like transporter
MKADVIDLDSLESSEDRAGLFFAAWSTATKMVGALGVGISLPALAYLGFDPTVVNGPDELFSLRAWFSLVPVLFYLASAALIVGYPITRARHAQIRSELEARKLSGDTG